MGAHFRSRIGQSNLHHCFLALQISFLRLRHELVPQIPRKVGARWWREKFIGHFAEELDVTLGVLLDAIDERGIDLGIVLRRKSRLSSFWSKPKLETHRRDVVKGDDDRLDLAV